MPGTVLGASESHGKGKPGPCLRRGFIPAERTESKQIMTWGFESSCDKHEDNEVQGVSRTHNSGLEGVCMTFLFCAPRNELPKVGQPIRDGESEACLLTQVFCGLWTKF